MRTSISIFWKTELSIWPNLGFSTCLSTWMGLFGQQRRFPLRKHFIPGCVGRGLDLDLRVRPALAPFRNRGFGLPWDHGRKTRFSNSLAHKRSKVSVKKTQIDFFHTCWDLPSQICRILMKVARCRYLKNLEICKAMLYEILKKWNRTCSPNQKFIKCYDIHSEWAHIQISGLEICRVKRCGPPF